jgi:predicted nucleic-acid-binding Zn-ribbon protein
MTGRTENCWKCGSDRMIKGARIIDRGHEGLKGNLSVEVYEKPDAIVFKKTHQGTLSAFICGECGYTELYVSNLAELWTTFSNQG